MAKPSNSSSNYGGMFNGADLSNAAGGSSSVPGAASKGRSAVPKPTNPPIPNVSTPQQRTLGVANMPFGANAFNNVQPGSPLSQKTLMGVKTADASKLVAPSWYQPVFNAMKPWNMAKGVTDTSVAPLKPATVAAGRFLNNPTPDNNPVADGGWSLAKQVGTNLGVFAGTRMGVEKGMRSILPKSMQLQALGQAAPTAGRIGRGLAKLKGGLLWDTPVNMALEGLDAAGIHNMEGHKPLRVWQKPKTDGSGNPTTNPDGSPAWEYGFNPSATGWDMKAHQADTTPSWTLGDRTTGSDAADAALSYGVSSLNAYQSPLKSMKALGDFSKTTFNPLETARNDYSKLKDMAAGKKVVNMNDASLPMTIANQLATRPDKPSHLYSSGSDLANSEAAILKRQDRYHPIYNREGTIGRPNMIGRMWDKVWN